VAPSTAAPASLTPDMIAAAKATLANSSALTVCTSLPYPPFEVDDGSGKIVGFDIDFMDAISKDLGVTTKIVVADFTAIKSGQAMKSKKCDIAAAAMTINAERVQAIEFSNAYYDASQALMVLSSSAVKSADDLKGKALGAQTGTTGLSFAQANAAKYGYTVQEFKQISDEEQALQSGKIDAAIHDQPALNDYFKAQKGKVKIIQNFQTGEQYGFGAAKGNTALAAVANYVIAQSFKDGTYKTSYEKWIGGTAPTKL
jgi:polar amino acid transport system substrate-binding protein